MIGLTVRSLYIIYIALYIYLMHCRRRKILYFDASINFKGYFSNFHKYFLSVLSDRLSSKSQKRGRKGKNVFALFLQGTNDCINLNILFLLSSLDKRFSILFIFFFKATTISLTATHHYAYKIAVCTANLDTSISVST